MHKALEFFEGDEPVHEVISGILLPTTLTNSTAPYKGKVWSETSSTSGILYNDYTTTCLSLIFQVHAGTNSQLATPCRPKGLCTVNAWRSINPTYQQSVQERLG